MLTPRKEIVAGFCILERDAGIGLYGDRTCTGVAEYARRNIDRYYFGTVGVDFLDESAVNSGGFACQPDAEQGIHDDTRVCMLPEKCFDGVVITENDG